jgi:hypothetical protein
MMNETSMVNTPEHNTPAVVSPTLAASPPDEKPVAASNTTKAVRVLEKAEFEMGRPRQIVDAGLLGMCIAFLVAFLSTSMDAHLNDAAIAFGVALPLIGWGFLQAALKADPTVKGWLLLEALLIGAWVAEGMGELAAYIGILCVLWHFSSAASLAALLASIFVLIIVPFFSFIGLLLYALINVKKLAKQQQATTSTSSATVAQPGQTPASTSTNS